MMMTRLHAAAAVFVTVSLSGPAAAPGEGELRPATFQQLRQQIRPQPGESRWMDLPWLIDLHEARKQAAAQGKPLFILTGGGATGIGPC